MSTNNSRGVRKRRAERNLYRKALQSRHNLHININRNHHSHLIHLPITWRAQVPFSLSQATSLSSAQQIIPLLARRSSQLKFLFAESHPFRICERVKG